MAVQGRGRTSPLPSHLSTPDGTAEAERLARSAMWQGYYQDQKDKPTEKDRASWMKDAYVFMKNNKDNLNDPEVKEILRRKLDRAGVSPVFKEREDIPAVPGEQLAGGQPGQVRGPGAGSLVGDAEATIHMLHQRFMMEHPSVYKPYTEETVDEQGRPSGRRQDPITGESQLFQRPPVASTPGTEHLQLREGGADVIHRTPTAEEGREWSINPQPDGSYWITDKSGKGKPTVVFPPDKEKAGDVKYRKAYELSLKEAAKDLDREMEKGGSMRRKAPWFWFNESDPDWEQRKQTFLEDRINFYLKQQGFGKDTGKTTSTPNLTPQQKKADQLLFGNKPQS